MLHTTAFIAALSYAQFANADPTGGNVTAGTASISSSGQTTTVTQSTDRAIIRWNTFDIGSSEHVQFVQPNSSSITVNRIKDTKASAIDGKLSANGRIVLINPNGLVFGSSAIVDVGGLVATTSDLEDDNAFMAGGALKFTKPGAADAKIINNGTMTAKDGGLIGLVAPNVENNGVIQARLGKVQLASGDIHTIDFAGDGLIKLEISDDMYARTVKNTGTITADGGEILLTAAAARGLVDALVINTGTLRAETITLPGGVQKAGRIDLSSIGLPDAVTYVTNGKAAIVNTGHISANGNLYDQVAGSITVLADSIRIGDGSVIEASGDAGGGSIRIGGDYQGGNGVPTSDLLYVSQDAIIEANARRRGNGGRIILWSDDNTRFYGHAEATGGTESGNGGLIEISGKTFLDFDGTINLLAAHGQSGYLLLDPTNISIASTSNANVNGSSPFAPNADDVTSVLNITTLTTALASGNVIVQTRATGSQAGNISVDAAISWASGNTLTLDAHNNIVVNQAISAGSGSVTMIAGGDVQFNANVAGTGTLTIQQANDTQTMGVAGGAGTLNLSTTDLTRIVDGWGNIILGRTSSSVAMTVNTRIWTDNLTLRNGTGTISIAGSQTMGANALTLTTNGGAISIGGVTGTGTVTATAGGGAITVGGAISTTGAVNLNTNGGNFSNSATIGSGALTLATAGGSLTLGAGATATGTTSLNSGNGAMAINAALNAGANALSLTTTGSNITSNASGVITSGALTVNTSNGNVSTNAAINASGVSAITTGTGTINLGAAITSGTGSLGLTTTGAAITTAGLTGGAITVNSNNANISIGSMTASGNSSVSSGNGTINIGATNTAANTLSLTTTGFAITTAAITSGALTIGSGGAIITTNGNIAASGTTTINSGGANIDIKAALGSGTGTLNLTTGGGALTTLTGAITSGAFNISTSGGNVTIGGTITATGVGSILSGAGTVTTAAISTGTSALGITTVAKTISTGNLTSGALTIGSGGANISTGTLSFSGTSSITAGAGTISIGAATGGTNALTLSNTGVNNITTAAITSGNLSITSGGGIVATNGAVAAAGTASITSGGGAINLNNAFTSTGTMTLTSGGGTITKGNTGAMSSAALNVTTSNGGFSVGTGGLTTTGATTINTGTGAAGVASTWTATGQTIGITTNNNTISLQVVNSGAITLGSSGGNITLGGAANSTFTGAVNITSGAGSITLTGAGTIGATTNAVNLTTTGGAINKNAALTTSTGAIAMNTSGGAISIGTGILQSTTSGGITLNSGGGNITVGGGGIQTATGTITINSGATGLITVNSIINLTGAGVLNITTDTDISLNIANALTGVGATLNVTQFTASKIIGIGTGATGDILFSAAEYAMIKDGWAKLVFGTLTATGGINVTAATWTDSVTFRSLSGVINLANAMSFAANNLTITTDADINLGGLLTGTGTLTITPTTNSTGIGIGTGQSGAISFTDTEKGYLHTTWGNIIIGSTTQTGDINIGATSWLDPMTFRTNTGIIYVNGAQTMAGNALSFLTNADLVLNANLTGTGALSIAASTATMGFGDSMTGTLNLTNAELSRIVFGWSGIRLGNTGSTGALNLGTWTWDDALTVTTNSGAITAAATTMLTNNSFTLTSTSGVVTVNGATLGTGGSMSINANANVIIAGNISGSSTGTLTISSGTAGATFGIGDTMTGNVNLTNAELAYIQSNWGNVVFGSTSITGAMNIGNYTWNNANVFFRTSTGIMTIAGATMGNNNLTLSTDSNIAINGALSGGTGTLTIRASANGTVTAIGDGQMGTLQVSSTELANIQSNWANVVIGHSALTGVTNVGAMNWSNNLTFISNTGAININDTQNMGTYNLTFTTNGNPTFAAGLAGTGNLTIQSTTNNIDMGIGDGQAGNVLLSNADLGNILNGWNSIIFSTTGTGADINLGAYTWQYDTLFRTGAGIITVAGDQVTNQDMIFETNSNIAINAALTGSGILTIRGQAVATTITVAGTGGNIVVDSTELARITDGWDQIVFGRSDATGALTASAYTWSDNVRYMTGAGVLTIGGAQTMGANNLTLTTNSNLALNAALTGTGNLVVEGAAASTTIGLAGGAGTLALTAAELNQITDGWASLTFGSITATGVVTVAAYTWKDNATFISNGNIAVTGAQGSNANTDVTYVTLAGNFVNSAGATPFSGIGTGGRYLIYSRAAGTDTYGGFTPPTSISSQTYFSQPPSSIAAGQNRIIYSTGAAKILYLQIDDKTKVYGDSLPTFTYTYLGGLQGGDLLGNAITSYTLSATGAAATDDVGVTRTIMGTFNTGLGYSVSVINGTLSVTKAPILVVAANASQAYGDANPGTTINYIGLRNGETSAVIDTLATASSGTDQYTNVGTYAINVSGAADNNYTFNYSNGTLTINKAVLTATTQDATREFGLANPSFSIVYTGFKNGEDDSVIDTLATASSTATATSNVGNYAINGTGGLDNNYSFSFANTGLLTVSKATLTGTTQNATREYGLANPTLSIVYTGFRNADTVAVVTTAATLTSGTNLTSNVGDYTISASGANATNYQFVYDNSGLLSITKATLTATSQNASRLYGDADPTFTFNYTGFRNSETAAVIDTLATGTTSATATSGVGTYTINGGGALDNNYTFVYTNTGLLTINKATLTATTQNVSREYGLANPTLGIAYTGFKNGEDESVINTLASATTGANIFSDVGSYAVTASGAVDDNYNIVYSNTGLLSVTKATLTVTGQNATREYGLANPALSVTYSGFRNGDTEANIDTLASVGTPATITSDVGTYNINGSGALDNNYQFSYTPGTLTITKATLTATTQNATREYGLANPTFNVVYTGFRNGEDQSVIDTLATATTAATIGSNVGTYGISSSGASDGNYQFTYANTGSLSITKATLTATTQDATREYGLANPTLNVVYTGFRNGEDQSVIDTLATATTAATIGSNVGTYGISSSGASDGNYQFTYVNTGNLNITKATLIATTQDATREYGLANPTLNVVYTGFRNGDDDTDIDTLATATTAATILSNVGTYGISASGASDGNYQFTYANTGNLSITKATLTATTQDATREYGLANPTLNVVYTGFRNGDDDTDIDTLATATTAATIGSNVGTYGITASGASDGNYQFTYANTGNLSITKATLTATTQDATREYGLANPTLNVVYTGFRNGDDSTDIDTLATATTAATILSNVGTYGISASGALDGNYQFTYANTGNLSITKATLTATTQNATREYGLANPTLNVVYTGFRNGDDQTDIDTLATATTAATILSNVGSYGISASGASDGNYQFTYANTGNLSITKATLTATTQDATREYGLANPTLNVVYTGFRNGDDDTDIDTLATATTAATIGSNVGTYGISASGASDGNYQFTYANTGNLSVTKATLTATTQNATREYGLANPTLNVVYTGFRNGDDSTDIDTLATATTAATILSNVGTYGISASGALDGNYQFTYANTGNLSITKATLTATTQNATREYGLANPTLNVVYTGFRNGDDQTDIDTLATATTAATILSNVGTYGITASGASDGNYQFTYANTGNLSVTKATLTATTQNATREYGLANPTFNVVYTGFRNGDDINDINTRATAATSATIGSNVGTYSITSSGASDNNYQFTYVNTGNLSVTKATLTVRADNKTREFSQPNPALTATYTGFRNGDNTGDINTLASLSTTAANGSAVGNYAITVGGAADNNYQFTYINGTLAIIADGTVITPPPSPTPTPTQPSTIPTTVEYSLLNPYTIITAPLNTGGATTGRISGMVPDIIFIPDDQIGNWQGSDGYLIAISDSLRREYYALMQQSGQQGY